MTNFLTVSDNTTLYGDFVSATFPQQVKSTRPLVMYGSAFISISSFGNRGNMTVVRECPLPPWVECEDQTYRHLTWGTNPMISDVIYSTTQILNTPTNVYIVNNTINIHGSFAHKFETLPNITRYNIDGTTHLGSTNENVTAVFEQRKEMYDILTKKRCDYDVTTIFTTTHTFYNGTTCLGSIGSANTIIFDAQGDGNALFYIIYLVTGTSTWTVPNEFTTQLVNGTSEHNIHWVIMAEMHIQPNYPGRHYIHGHIHVHNFTLSTATSANTPGILELDRFLVVYGSLHARYSRYSAITDLHVYSSGLPLYGDIEPSPPPNTICVRANGTCTEGFHFNVTCDEVDATFYSGQLCAAYLETVSFNRPNSSCVLADGTCMDGVRQNITCDQEGATFYYDRTCAQYVPPAVVVPVWVNSSCTYANGTCEYGLNVTCPAPAIYVENQECQSPVVDTTSNTTNSTIVVATPFTLSQFSVILTMAISAVSAILIISISVGILNILLGFRTIPAQGNLVAIDGKPLYAVIVDKN